MNVIFIWNNFDFDKKKTRWIKGLKSYLHILLKKGKDSPLIFIN